MNQIKKKLIDDLYEKNACQKKKYEAQFQTNSFILNNKIKKPKK
jgi:sulfatase maturation enzyme AslB (radical SAM superfamily)